MLARVYLRLARLVHWQVGMASSRRDVLSRLQPLLQVVILAFGLFCLGIAQDVFIPIALAMLLTFVLSPIVERLQRWHVPRVAAVVVTVVFAFSVLGGLGWLLASQATTLAADLPQYKHNLTRKIREVRRVGKSDSLEKAQSAVKEVIGELQKDGAVAAKKPPQPVVVEKPPPGGLDSLRATLAPIADVLATVGFVVVLVIFMLIERQRLLERIIRLGGTARVTLTTKILGDAADRIGRYLQAQSLINTGFGVTIATGLFLIGVPYALLFKGDEDGARAVFAQYVKEHPTADVYEEALLPVLARVRRDASRGALTAQESAFITGAIRRVVDESEDGGRPAAQDEAAAAPVLEALACPARDEVDAAALRMLAARVATEGVRLDVADAGVLAAEVLERVEAMRPGVVVVASVAANGLGHCR